MENSDIIGPASVPLPGSDMFVLGMSIIAGIVAVLALVVGTVIRVIRRRRGSRAKRPIGLVVCGVLAVVSLVAGLMLWPRDFFVPEFPPLPRMFPDRAFLYRSVSDLEVTRDSPETIAAIGDLPFATPALGSARDGRTGGIPFNFVDRHTPRHTFDFTYPGASDDAGYPIADPAYVQSMPLFFADNHYVGIDLSRRRMWELAGIRRWFWLWQAGSGAIWDLDSLEYPKGLTTASGLPLIPLAYSYEEVLSGDIGHVLMLSMPTVRIEEHQWPARHTDGPSQDPDAPVMGTWFRLRSDVDISGLGPQARVIARALRDYGAVLGDTGGALALNGVPDARWDDADLATFGELGSDDLEVVDASELMVEPGSMEVLRAPRSG